MSKVIAVVGATGVQGGSVVQALLKQGDFRIRGITRNVNSDKAKALRTEGVELVAADMNDVASLVKAFEGVTAIFAVTDFSEPFTKDGPDHAMDVEYIQGVNLARAAQQTPTLKHYIWSTLPNSRKISDGKFIIPHFNSKSRIDDFIKSEPELLAKTTFLWVTFYASNFFNPVFQPFLLKSIGTYAYIQPVAPSTVFALAGDASVNVGIFARAILSNPSKTLGGKYVFGSVESMSNGDYIKLWERVTGKQTHYLQVSFDEYDRLFGPIWGAEMSVMLQFWEHVGEKSWSGEEVVLTAGDLEVQGELVTIEEAFRSTDWTALD